MPVAIAELVTIEECLVSARQSMDEVHPGAEKVLGQELVDFCVRFAAKVAFECAVEATRRAHKKPCAAEISASNCTFEQVTR